MSQTSITAMGRGLEGAMAKASGLTEIATFVCPAGGLQAGRYVTDDGPSAAGEVHACSLPNSAADITGGVRGGIVLATSLHEGAVAYAAGELVPVLVRGWIWTLPSGGSTRGVQLSVRYAAGSGSAPLGRIELTPVTSETALLPGAWFDETASDGALAMAKIGVIPA